MKRHLYIPLIFVVLLLAACKPTTTPSPNGTSTTEVASSPTSTGSGEPTSNQGKQPTDVPFVMPTEESFDPNCDIRWSHLRPGYQAYLTYTSGRNALQEMPAGLEGQPFYLFSGMHPNRVRSEPARKAGNVIGQLYPGERVEVVAGPVCADGMMFWQIRHDSLPNGIGWTSEGNGREKRWMEPVVCGGSLYRNHYAIVMPGVKGLRVYEDTQNPAKKLKNVIAELSAGMIVKVLDEPPMCLETGSHDLVYWKVEVQDTQIVGLVAEYGYENGSFEQYLRYLEEIVPEAFPHPSQLATIAPKFSKPSTLKLSDLQDAGRIAYITNDWTSVISADGSNSYELRNPLGKYTNPHSIATSPDGKYVLMAIGTKVFRLSMIETDEGWEAVELTPSIPYAKSYRDLVWSPNGQYIAFVVEVEGDQSRQYLIYVMKSDGSDLRKISVDHDVCFSPTWSPTNKYVAYVCWEDYGANLYVSHIASSGTATYEAMGYLVAWSPDGKYLAFNDDEEGLGIIEAETGKNIRILVPEGSNSFAWSPDSKSIAFTYEDQIYLVRVVDGQITNLTGHTVDMPFEYVFGYLDWSPDGKYIVFEFRTYHSNEKYWRAHPIYILDVTTGARAQLVEEGIMPVWAPIFKPQYIQLPDCTNGWSRLRAGQKAVVLGNRQTDPPNRVREEGSKSAKQIGILYAGTVVDVLEGPVCSDGLVYWKIKGTIYPPDPNSTETPPQVGWTAEGDLKNYWLGPYQP
ncbi:MAG: hypothetical protein N2049_01535 [Anaerolineales bacterium]|nr:hypothetical protein [Anaerolineales bacterium]